MADLAPPPLTPADLAARVHAAMAQAQRKKVRLSDVQALVNGLDLSDEDAPRTSPRLRIASLWIGGSKYLHGADAPVPINYRQTFASGVNVVLIPDNDVGKSSILKTIRFALTGDNSDYDADVRNWITDVRLGFTLDDAPFTVALGTRDGVLLATLVPGDHAGSVEDLAAHPARLFAARTIPKVQEELQRFFFDRLALPQLSWAQHAAHDPSTVSEASASWLTYFQPLVIPDGGDDYLLCDSKHAMGNQEGLIFSAYLGLRLAVPLNRLGVDASRSKREGKLRSEDVKSATEEVGRLANELQGVDAELAAIGAAQHARRTALEADDPGAQIAAVTSEIFTHAAQLRALEGQRENLVAQTRAARARARRLREAIDLRRHFSGIEVSLCPNCERAIPDARVEQERTTYCCRLCGAFAADAATDDLARLEAEARASDAVADRTARDREGVANQIREVQGAMAAANERADSLRQAARTGVSFALPTAEEDRRRTALLETRGRLRAAIQAAERRAGASGAQAEAQGLREYILDKIRDVLKTIAAERNRRTLDELSRTTQAIAQRIGAESITNVDCSPLGRLQLRKHGQQVSFGTIRNQGERLRVKLAFFVAMMALSRTVGLGRHPGLLMIDQPGSSEMVPEDFAALAAVLKDIDQTHGDELQVLCFTARPELRAATTAERVYGAKAGKYAF